VTVDGMAFTLYDGAAAWDHSGKVTAGVLSKHCAPIVPPTCAATGLQCLADTDCCGYPLNRCISGLCEVPAGPLVYSSQSYARDYTANCPAGDAVTWRFFDWQTITPDDSQLSFSAQTAPTVAAVGAARSITLAIVTGAPVTTWTGVDVSAKFAAATPPVLSSNVLRVTTFFQPSSDGKQAPTLVAWRANYDCVPSE
jgi:hypothetical protein